MLLSAYSERIYKDQAKLDDLKALLTTCNDVKAALYAGLRNGSLDMKTLSTPYIIDKYNVNTYYAVICMNAAKAVVESNQELQKLYVKDFDEKIRRKTIAKENKEDWLAKLRKVKQICIQYSQGTLKQSKSINPFFFKYNGGNISVVYHKERFDNLYDFELFLNQMLRNAKRNLWQIKTKIAKLEYQKQAMQEKAPVTCFGTKHLFKLQYTTDIDHDEWLRKFRLQRYGVFTIPGNENFAGGSKHCRYDEKRNVLRIMSPKQGSLPEGGKHYRSEWFEIPCKFVYRGENLVRAVHSKHRVAYTIIDKGDYYIVMATFDADGGTLCRTLTHDNGVVAVDINYDRFACANIDSNGNLVSRKIIHFNIDGKSSGQRKKIIEKAVNELYAWVTITNKPLVRENLESIQFKDSGNPKTNKKLSQFAYNMMISAIDRKFSKKYAVPEKVYPAYTSQQGKIKYMRPLGISVHESAALCIGRRAMFSKVGATYYEDMKPYSHFGDVKSVSKAFRKLNLQEIYSLGSVKVNPNKYENVEDYITAVKAALFNRCVEKNPA